MALQNVSSHHLLPICCNFIYQEQQTLCKDRESLSFSPMILCNSLFYWPEPGHILPETITVNRIMEYNGQYKIFMPYPWRSRGSKPFQTLWMRMGKGEFANGKSRYFWKKMQKWKLWRAPTHFYHTLFELIIYKSPQIYKL